MPAKEGKICAIQLEEVLESSFDATILEKHSWRQECFFCVKVSPAQKE
jgi:hypothetical protein